MSHSHVCSRLPKVYTRSAGTSCSFLWTTAITSNFHFKPFFLLEKLLSLSVLLSALLPSMWMMVVEFNVVFYVLVTFWLISQVSSRHRLDQTHSWTILGIFNSPSIVCFGLSEETNVPGVNPQRDGAMSKQKGPGPPHLGIDPRTVVCMCVCMSPEANELSTHYSDDSITNVTRINTHFKHQGCCFLFSVQTKKKITI